MSLGGYRGDIIFFIIKIVQVVTMKDKKLTLEANKCNENVESTTEVAVTKYYASLWRNALYIRNLKHPKNYPS